MNDGDRRLGDACAADEFRARNVAHRGAEVEHRAREVLGGVDLPVDAEDLLRARDADIVRETGPVMAEAGPVAGAREQRSSRRCAFRRGS